MKLKSTPYIVIFFFTLLVSVFRYFLIPDWTIWIHLAGFCLQFVFLSLIWKLVEFLNNWLARYMPLQQSVGKRIMVQILLSIIIIAPFYLTLIMAGKKYLPKFANPQFLAVVGVVFVTFTALVNFIFYFRYFFERWQQSVVENARLQVTAAELDKEKSIMQYHHLRNQVNPHFLFNTLSSLDGLIQSDPRLASEFVRHLSKVYRYVLEHKENEVVPMQTELNFIQHYISLLHLRYNSALCIDIKVSGDGAESGIVMVTLQMLIDNAIKHNAVHTSTPLHIKIWDEAGYYHIRNNVQPRRQMELSNGQGLLQLKQLYSYISPQPVVIKDNNQYFEVQLPQI